MVVLSLISDFGKSQASRLFPFPSGGPLPRIDRNLQRRNCSILIFAFRMSNYLNLTLDTSNDVTSTKPPSYSRRTEPLSVPGYLI